MDNAVINGDSVLLAMHVPFGNMLQNANPVNYLVLSYNDRFLEIISKYSDIIIGMVGGHEHLVELKVLTKQAQAVNFLINVPALATYSGNAPGFNTVYFTKNSNNRQSKGSWVIQDYDVFHFIDISENPVLEKLFTFRNAYCDNYGYQSTGVLDCLQHIPVSQIENITNSYHTGNPNFTLNLTNPDNIFTALPVYSSESSPASSSSFALIPIIAGIASITGVVAVTAFVCHKIKAKKMLH